MNSPLDEKLGRMIEATGKVEPGTIVHLKIAHDPHCPAIQTKSLWDCICVPDVEGMATNFRIETD